MRRISMRRRRGRGRVIKRELDVYDDVGYNLLFCSESFMLSG